jgi:hypothetical protein
MDKVETAAFLLSLVDGYIEEMDDHETDEQIAMSSKHDRLDDFVSYLQVLLMLKPTGGQ